MPEGSRYIQISHTLAKNLSDELKAILKGESESNEWFKERGCNSWDLP